MDDMLKALQTIQKDLVGIIIPAALTAVVSIIALIVNTIYQAKSNKHLYKDKQLEEMRRIYPTLKGEIIVILCFYEQIMLNPLYRKEKKFFLGDYINIDWGEYRKTITASETQWIDQYQLSISSIIEELKKLHEIFMKKNIPIHSNSLRRYFSGFQIYCAHFYINTQARLKLGRKQRFEYRRIKRLLHKLDRHYSKY